MKTYYVMTYNKYSNFNRHDEFVTADSYDEAVEMAKKVAEKYEATDYEVVLI